PVLHVPACGERRPDGAVGPDAGEALEDIGIDDLVDRGGGTRRGIEVRRLQHHAEGDGVLRGKRGAGDKGEECGGRGNAVEHLSVSRVRPGCAGPSPAYFAVFARRSSRWLAQSLLETMLRRSYDGATTPGGSTAMSATVEGKRPVPPDIR